MWFDADIDAIMTRTVRRPIPAGRVRPSEALVFGALLAAFSVMTLGLLVNWASAALLAFTIFFYAVVYTMWLKRWTPQNIVIGGAAGAFPPVVAWVASTGSLAVEPLLLFLIIFLWTPPHFWALALDRAGDYARAGVPMMPVAAGADRTRRQILGYTLLLAPAGLLPAAFGYAGLFSAIVAALLGAGMIVLAVRVWREGEGANRAGKQLFGFSILYLFLLFAAFLAEALLGLGPA